MSAHRKIKYADIHAHLTLKPFLNTTNNNPSSIWKFAKTSFWGRSGKARTNMENIIKGRVKTIFVALGYIEKGWQVVNSYRFKLLNLFRNTSNLLLFLMNVNTVKIDNYFSLLLQEMDFLIRQAKPPLDVDQELKKYQLFFPHTLQDYEQALKDNSKVIVIPTIEGANNLINGTVSYQKPYIGIEQIKQNVKQIKKHVLRPIFITFTHHFYNGLAGHARSLYKISKFIDQEFGLGNPISKDGWKIIQCLLGLDSTCGSWRILIDTKHFSLAARREYYDFISKDLNYSIPVINSHAAYSGNLMIEQVIYPSALFSTNQTNISAEEVYHIWRSKGLLGINFDEKLLWTGPKISDASIIRENIIAMVQGAIDFAKKEKLVEPDESIWDIFCIGTDFDGFINPLDSYTSPLNFSQLEQDLIDSFSVSKQLAFLPIKIDIDKIVIKFMYENVNNFLKRYFSAINYLL